MVIVTLQQIIDEKISFLREQINPNNKPELNSTFQVQIDTIRSAAYDLENVEPLIKQKKELLKNSKSVYESGGCLLNWTVWNGCNDRLQSILDKSNEAELLNTRHHTNNIFIALRPNCHNYILLKYYIYIKCIENASYYSCNSSK